MESLELPEAFGLRMSIANVAQAEPGEIRDYDEEPQDSHYQEQRGEKEGGKQPKRGFQAAEVRDDFATDGALVVGERHYIFNGLDWL